VVGGFGNAPLLGPCPLRGVAEEVVGDRDAALAAVSTPGQVWLSRPPDIHWIPGAISRLLTSRLRGRSGDGDCCPELLAGVRGKPSPSTKCSPVRSKRQNRKKALPMTSFSGRKAPPGQKRPSRSYCSGLSPGQHMAQGTCVQTAGRVRSPCFHRFAEILKHRVRSAADR